MIKILKEANKNYGEQNGRFTKKEPGSKNYILAIKTLEKMILQEIEKMFNNVKQKDTMAFDYKK